MRNRDFERLKLSIRQVGAIIRGELKPLRSYTPEDILGPDVVALIVARRDSGLTHEGFAEVMGVSERTVQAWAKGRRKLTGAARALVHMMAAHPEIAIETASKVKALRETRQPPEFVARAAKRGGAKKTTKRTRKM